MPVAGIAVPRCSWGWLTRTMWRPWLYPFAVAVTLPHWAIMQSGQALENFPGQSLIHRYCTSNPWMKSGIPLQQECSTSSSSFSTKPQLPPWRCRSNSQHRAITLTWVKVRGLWHIGLTLYSFIASPLPADQYEIRFNTSRSMITMQHFDNATLVEQGKKFYLRLVHTRAQGQRSTSEFSVSTSSRLHDTA